ncbi:MAG: DNA repair ATPase [Flammeovirgaceae bacterium]
MAEEKITPAEETQLEGGTYEIIRKRLENHGRELQDRLTKLNQARKEVFGSIETKLLTTERIATVNNCVPRDMIPIGRNFIFGYNVHIGLKSEVDVTDVFSIFEFKQSEHTFHEAGIQLIDNQSFKNDFKELYKYYKNTIFTKFAMVGPHLHMVFRIGKNINDIKSFKWLIEGDKLVYIDNRSDHEFKFPTQHEFEWKRTHRDYHRSGDHPHISILDRVFVETVGGDLTIKVEDNTDSGHGIYSEDVEHKGQSLDDADITYADLGNLILLRIKPYQEKAFRYLVFNEKLQEVKRIDSIEDSCVLLPDNHGIIFSNGYYLDSGELKIFDNELTDMRFERKVQSPNGEDFLYVFYNRESGDYVLLSYNLIEQKVENPILCHGYSFFHNGELVYFRTDSEPKKTHAIQLWQTPYVHPDYQMDVTSDNYLFKIGNKDIVRGMSEAHEVVNLTLRENVYASLYFELVKRSTSVIDTYYWTADKEAFSLGETLLEIKNASSAAIEEFEKVTRVKKSTKEQIEKVAQNATALMREIDRKIFKEVDEFVSYLAQIRTARGEVISLKDLRYTDLALVEEFETKLSEKNDRLSQKCVEFLLREDSLAPYEHKVELQEQAILEVSKVADADKTAENIDLIGSELELLIDIVSNLKIEDSTQTTKIIDNISNIYSHLNNVKAKLRAKRKDLLGSEAIAEFNAQLKLINQAVVNFLDVSDTPDKCDEYLTKLMVQLEELEGKFVDFDDFTVELAEKRDEIYNAFESKKLALVEARNKRSTSLMSAAERILKGIQNRIKNFESVSEINGYFAGDLMVDKVRDIVNQLVEMEDSVKADDIQSQMKTVKEDAIRQLKDRQELFVAGENIIKMGKHHFSVNTQDLDLSMVYRNGEMYYHLSGTNFFELVEHEAFLATKSVWDQSVVSENREVYRAEFLAYQLLKEADELEIDVETELQEYVRKYAAPRYHEGYVKGVHDQDAYLIFDVLLSLKSAIGLLRYTADARALASIFWHNFLDVETKELFTHRVQGLEIILQVFPETKEFGELIVDFQAAIQAFADDTSLFDARLAKEAGEYLFYQLTKGQGFDISTEANELYKGFHQQLKRKNVEQAFNQSLKKLQDVPLDRFELIRNWVKAYVGVMEKDLESEEEEVQTDWREYINETAVLIFNGNYDNKHVIAVSAKRVVEGMAGEHAVIKGGKYLLDYNHFVQKLATYESEVLPQYEQYVELKKELVQQFKKDLRLDEFKPRVLSSFVRNKLIDEVYLPIIGDNLAKQIGVVGENKRTDLMGMLLLISPPGYGKTTLMEYISSRLGLIFMKINGPAIGHGLTSLDPMEAPNASAREEVEKLNLAFEMGDNVMIYLDDIQHCNPEFLQKFISLCDGQRKIEGVYKGVSKTYDLRGKKVCVVMAGNPYTESGDKFQIPDMLANRADTYNLGDIIGDTQEPFELSYIENSLTSNPILGKLTAKSKKDIYTLIRLAKTDNREGIEFESNISGEELNEYVSVLKKMVTIQDVILKVNQQYIASAAQQDDYRTEPAFKLQGSYRNMNKLAEKVVPIMNEQELRTLILSHYEGESQTLTTGAEANMLKFKEMVGIMEEAEKARWEQIKKTFQKNQKLRGVGGTDQISQVIAQMTSFTDGLEAIKEVLAEGLKTNGE